MGGGQLFFEHWHFEALQHAGVHLLDLLAQSFGLCLFAGQLQAVDPVYAVREVKNGVLPAPVTQLAVGGFEFLRRFFVGILGNPAHAAQVVVKTSAQVRTWLFGRVLPHQGAVGLLHLFGPRVIPLPDRKLMGAEGEAVGNRAGRADRFGHGPILRQIGVEKPARTEIALGGQMTATRLRFGFRDHLQRLRQLAPHRIQMGQAGQGLAKIPLEFERLPKGLFRFFVAADDHVEHTERGIRPRLIGGHVAVRDEMILRLGKTPPGHRQLSDAVLRPDPLRVGFDELAVTGLGIVPALVFPQKIAAEGDGKGVVRMPG